MKPKETVDYHIKTCWHLVSNLYNQIADKHELTQATGYVLLNIHSKGTPATKIAPLMGMKATSLSRMLKNMEDEGLIIRKQDKNDKRMVNVFLTEKGIGKQRIAKQVVREYNQFIIDGVPPEKLQSFFEVMEIMKDLTIAYKNEKIDL